MNKKKFLLTAILAMTLVFAGTEIIGGTYKVCGDPPGAFVSHLINK